MIKYIFLFLSQVMVSYITSHITWEKKSQTIYLGNLWSTIMKVITHQIPGRSNQSLITALINHTTQAQIESN